MIFGYARVSTTEQNIQNQVDLLQNFGCEKIYTDVVSGVREDRKGLNEMLSFLREGDENRQDFSFSKKYGGTH